MRKKNFAIQMGLFSSNLEHVVPEQIFSTDQTPAEAVSTVKFLSRANELGQRIYHLTPENFTLLLANIRQDSAILNDITDALNAGKEVIVHTDPLTISGYTGAGYMIFDPDTGDGAYRITGGINGGAMIIGVFFFIGLIILIAPIFGLIGLVISAFAFINFVVYAQKVKAIAKSDLTPDQAFDRLNKLSFAIVAAMLISINPIFIELGAVGTALDILVSAWITMIAAVLL